MTAPAYYRSQAGYALLQAHYDASLTEWPVTPESIMVETDLGQTHVLRVGEPTKPALMYFHGWNGNAAGTHSELDLPRLTDRFCVYIPDIPGHTGRSVAVRPDTKTRAFADWVRDMLNALAIDRVYLAGVSGGGYVACKASAHLADRVIQLLGIVPHGIPPAALPPLKFWMVVIPSFMNGKRGIRHFVERMGSPIKRGQAQISIMTEYMLLMNKHFKPNYNPKPLTDDELQSITCPVQVIFGRHDITMKSDVAAARARKLIPNVHVQMLEAEGHLLTSDGLQRVNDLLYAWVG